MKRKRIDPEYGEEAQSATDRKNGYTDSWRLAVRGILGVVLVAGGVEVAKKQMYRSAEYRAPAWPAAELKRSYGENDCEATLTIRFQRGELDGEAVLEQLLSELGLRESGKTFKYPLPIDPAIVETFKKSMKIVGNDGNVILANEPSVSVAPFFLGAPPSNPNELLTIKIHFEREKK